MTRDERAIGGLLGPLGPLGTLGPLDLKTIDKQIIVHRPETVMECLLDSKVDSISRFRNELQDTKLLMDKVATALGSNNKKQAVKMLNEAEQRFKDSEVFFFAAVKAGAIDAEDKAEIKKGIDMFDRNFDLAKETLAGKKKPRANIGEVVNFLTEGIDSLGLMVTKKMSDELFSCLSGVRLE